MAALPIDQSEMVLESQLKELAHVLTVGIPENDVLFFADYQMELMRELCIFLQGVHADSKQSSRDLARAVCALSVLRVHLKGKDNNLENVKYDPFSRYKSGMKIQTMAQKLGTFSKALLVKKHHEIITYAAYMDTRTMAGLGSSVAFRQILLAAHVLILDAHAHIYMEGPYETDPFRREA